MSEPTYDQREDCHSLKGDPTPYERRILEQREIRSAEEWAKQIVPPAKFVPARKPSVHVLEVPGPLTQAQHDRYLSRWNGLTKGSANEGDKLLIIDGGAKFMTLSPSVDPERVSDAIGVLKDEGFGDVAGLVSKITGVTNGPGTS